MEEQDLINRVKTFEREGFEFFQAWTMDEPVSPDRVRMPSGRIMDIDELDLARAIDAEANRALQYYDTLRQLPIDQRDHYTSFVDDADMEMCRKKYRRGG